MRDAPGRQSWASAQPQRRPVDVDPGLQSGGQFQVLVLAADHHSRHVADGQLVALHADRQSRIDRRYDRGRLVQLVDEQPAKTAVSAKRGQKPTAALRLPGLRARGRRPSACAQSGS